MVGSDSKVEDIKRFPPFAGLGQPQPDVRFAYCLGRENKTRSDGWVDLTPVNGIVGPELSFARKVTRHIRAPIAIIKVAAGGTHLGGDWNPDNPTGFRMYPLALDVVRSALAGLDAEKIPYRLEGFMWHQGENDMFNDEYRENYGANLSNFIDRWRRDLQAPQLKFYIGELCTKTIWGMDLRPRMHAISLGQRAVTKSDPLAEYIPTSHIAAEIGNPVGLHYHYGTLGQLEHGENYADAYLRTIGETSAEQPNPPAPAAYGKDDWPFPPESRVRLFVLAGHRNMEGERAFVEELSGTPHESLLASQPSVPYRYSIGGGVKASSGWQPLHPAGYYHTFGPELSFGHSLSTKLDARVAIAKFTHSGSQMNDWTPAGSVATTRHLYPKFIAFVQDSIAQLEARGHKVDLAGILYHVGENEMSMPPYRRQAADWLRSTVEQSRTDLGLPNLRWYVSQQRPTDHERVNQIDVVQAIARVAAADDNLIHIRTFDVPEQPKRLVFDTAGIVWLGQRIADSYLADITRTAPDADGFVSIFDGSTLNGWSCVDMSYWSVRDEAITGESTEQNPCTRNKFIVWHGGELADFEVKLKFRVQGNGCNSGVQFRSAFRPDGLAVGYQADIYQSGGYLGGVCDELHKRDGPELLSANGSKSVIAPDGKRTAEPIGPPVKMNTWPDWNDYHITARGNRVILRINGQVSSELVDQEEAHLDLTGYLGLQLRSGKPMTVQFKDIRLRVIE